MDSERGRADTESGAPSSLPDLWANRNVLTELRCKPRLALVLITPVPRLVGNVGGPLSVPCGMWPPGHGRSDLRVTQRVRLRRWESPVPDHLSGVGGGGGLCHIGRSGVDLVRGPVQGGWILEETKTVRITHRRDHRQNHDRTLSAWSSKILTKWRGRESGLGTRRYREEPAVTLDR